MGVKIPSEGSVKNGYFNSDHNYREPIMVFTPSYPEGPDARLYGLGRMKDGKWYLQEIELEHTIDFG